MLSALSLCSICSQRPTTTDAVVPWYNMVQPSNTIAINSSFSPPVPCSRKHGWSMVWLIHLVPRKMREHANRCQQLWDRIRLEFMESYCKQKWQRISSQGLSQINCGLLAAQGRTRGTKNPAKWPVHFRTPGPRYVYFIFISLKFKITQNTKKRSACQCISWASYAHRSEWCLMTLIAMRLGSCASPKTWRLYPHV